MNCPTFVATGLETESPRGRLHLIRAADEGRIEINDSFIRHMELCLQCRNCEAVCPSGVPFGRIMEATRAQILTQNKGKRSTRMLRKAITRALFPHKTLIKVIAAAMRLYQHGGPRRLLHRTRILKYLPRQLGELEAMMPPISSHPFEPRWAYSNGPERRVPSMGASPRRRAVLAPRLGSGSLMGGQCGVLPR